MNKVVKLPTLGGATYLFQAQKLPENCLWNGHNEGGEIKEWSQMKTSAYDKWLT